MSNLLNIVKTGARSLLHLLKTQTTLQIKDLISAANKGTVIAMTQSMSLDMQHGLQALTACKTTCTETLTNYLQKNSQSRDLSLMCLLRDCAEMCLMSVNLMMDGSEFMGRTFLICAEMCDATARALHVRCAMACEAYPEDLQMMACAQACRACSECCSSMGRLSSAYFRRPNFATIDTLLAVS